jgi:hypothetical protein
MPVENHQTAEQMLGVIGGSEDGSSWAYPESSRRGTRDRRAISGRPVFSEPCPHGKRHRPTSRESASCPSSGGIERRHGNEFPERYDPGDYFERQRDARVGSFHRFGCDYRLESAPSLVARRDFRLHRASRRRCEHCLWRSLGAAEICGAVLPKRRPRECRECC